MSIDRGLFLAALLTMGGLAIGCGDDEEPMTEEPTTDDGTSGSEADTPPEHSGSSTTPDEGSGTTDAPPADDGSGEAPAPAPTGE